MSITTRVISVDLDHPAVEALDEAAGVIRGGGLVAFATETVYGLGADATNPEAVARIFAAKGRPATNPLIVHALDSAMARSCVDSWTAQAETLARHFWPGPLTFVLPRSAILPDAVTAGQPTVGVRVPRNRIAQGLIALAGRPIAAPSANRSTGVSPTLADHVLADLDGRVELILDSGQTAVGIESTVLDLTTREPRILRPGPISAAELEHVLGGVRVRDASEAPTPDRPLSPGQMTVHYAPRTRAVRLDSPADLAGFAWPTSVALLVFGRQELPPLPPLPHLIEYLTPEVAARGLYRALHVLDALGLDLIVVVPPPDVPEWHAIRDRLWRATAPNSP